MTSKSLSLEDVLAAIAASSHRTEVLASEQEVRLINHVASSREEVLQLVSADIDSAVSEVRSELSQQVRGVREECEEQHQVIKSTAAFAVASVDDLRSELASKDSELLDQIRLGELDPLRKEFKEELAARDLVIAQLKDNAAVGEPGQAAPLISAQSLVENYFNELGP